jgi:nucleoid-associated protein YejK
MTITLHQLAIHELVKLPESNEAELRLSDQLLFVDEKAEELVTKLNKTCVQKNDVLNGRLAAPEDALFPGYFQLLQESAFAEDAFLQFSRDSMQALQLSLQGVVGAKGGYLVYAFYSTGEGEFEQHWIGIFLVRDTNGLVFQAGENGNFQLHPTTYLDIDRMALAGRIAIRKGAEAYQPQIEVIKHARTQKEISDYFLSWLGIEESVSNRELTHHFLEAVAAVPTPLDEETGEPMQEGVFREQLANFAMKSPGKVLNIPAFEEKFYGAENPIQTYLSDQEVKMQDAFRFDQQAVREYHFHKFKGQGLYFGCKHAFLLSGQVRIENQQVIIDDPDLAEQINDILSGLVN